MLIIDLNWGNFLKHSPSGLADYMEIELEILIGFLCKVMLDHCLINKPKRNLC